jgi:hypothetical protein
MEILLGIVGGITLFNLMKKEGFEETYYDSEVYYKQNTSKKESDKVNKFMNYDNDISFKNKISDFRQNYLTDESVPLDIKANSLHSDKEINGIPLKDYYEKYSNDVLSGGRWFLNKDMPQETKQYQNDSQIQQKMEIFTGLQQKRDRETLGVPNKTELQNMFTPEEKTTGYGYQYSTGGGGGPGLSITRAKEIEDFRESVRLKTNEQPFEKIQVGRGLAMDPSVPAAGGFQEFTRILPSNIGDHKANQLPGRVTGGKWVFSNAPTSHQPVLKNRPNGYYSLCQRGPAAGRAVMTAETIRPDVSVLLKNQNRTTINYGFGGPLTNLESFLVK